MKLLNSFTEEYISKRVERTNRIYGGLDLNATRVIHVHGGLDPWRVLGITETRNPLSPAILIPGTATAKSSDLRCFEIRSLGIYLLTERKYSRARGWVRGECWTSQDPGTRCHPDTRYGTILRSYMFWDQEYRHLLL